MRRVLSRLDAVHKKLLTTVRSVDPRKYSQRPSEKEWSVGEIVQHLCLVEERVTHELKAALARKPEQVSLLKRLVPTAIVSSRVVRVKAPKAVDPIDAPKKELALQNFENARQTLKALCDAHGSNRFKKVIFKHPFLGKIDGVATISFLSYHERRHHKQMLEVLKKLGHSTNGVKP